jgi:hypothetical protein
VSLIINVALALSVLAAALVGVSLDMANTIAGKKNVITHLKQAKVMHANRVLIVAQITIA